MSALTELLQKAKFSGLHGDHQRRKAAENEVGQHEDQPQVIQNCRLLLYVLLTSL